MSDGISEGYRAAAASDNFEKLWEDAQVEQILLDLKSRFADFQVQDLIQRMMVIIPRIQLRNYDKFLIPYAGGSYMSDSAPQGDTYAKVRLYEVEVSGRMHRKFVNSDFKSGLIEALLFAEWLETNEGKRATDVYNDW